MKHSALLSILLLINSSCKQFKKKEMVGDWVITMDILVTEGDVFQLYFIPDNWGQYSEENKSVANVPGSKKFQKVTFSISEAPTKFRIDLGEKGHESSVIVRQILIRYGGESFIIERREVNRYFVTNVYAKLSHGAIMRSNEDGRYDPFIESTALLEKKMELTFGLFDK